MIETTAMYGRLGEKQIARRSHQSRSNTNKQQTRAAAIGTAARTRQRPAHRTTAVHDHANPAVVAIGSIKSTRSCEFENQGTLGLNSMTFYVNVDTSRPAHKRANASRDEVEMRET